MKILATDIDTAVLEAAELGVYSVESLAPLGAEARRRFFLPAREQPGHIVISPELKSLVRFGRLNLVHEPWPMRAPFDFVFCRNVTIYFDRADAARRSTSGCRRRCAPTGISSPDTPRTCTGSSTSSCRSTAPCTAGRACERPRSGRTPAPSPVEVLAARGAGPSSKDEDELVLLPVGGVFASRKPGARVDRARLVRRGVPVRSRGGRSAA